MTGINLAPRFVTERGNECEKEIKIIKEREDSLITFELSGKITHLYSVVPIDKLSKSQKGKSLQALFSNTQLIT